METGTPAEPMVWYTLCRSGLYFSRDMGTVRDTDETTGGCTHASLRR